MNHNITTLKVRDLDECELRCYYEHNCVSLNFENKMVGNGKYSCELNNSTHEEHAEDFVMAQNFLYRETNNPCGSSPCKNNGTCQSGFTKKGYHCLCCGWTGARCQYDIDECDEKSHDCSKNADCTNTKGSYKCKCKTGFSGDGYNCTDIDECQEKRCGTNEVCTNTEGSFRCTCNDSYYGDGYSCTECYTIFDFEDHDLSNWTLNGTAFNNQPTYGNNTSARNVVHESNHTGDWWIGTFENRSSPSEPSGGLQGDGPQGSLTSPSFQVTEKFLKFLIGAGCKVHTVPNIRAELIVDGEVVRKETPAECKEAMTEKSWNVTDYAGKNAQFQNPQFKLYMMSLALFTICLISQMHGSEAVGGPCKTSERSISGKALKGHTFKEFAVRGIVDCQNTCERDSRCASNNFYIPGKVCELNSHTKEEKPDHFVTDDQRFYMKREDEDECLKTPPVCHVNANCNNTLGSYLCFCKEGFMGDGKTCQDIDECDEKSHECSKNADCKNTKGSYRCKCKTGFYGAGYNCTDIDECQEKRCGKNATCTNTEGSFRCTCNIGYYGDGYKCTECYTIFDFEDHDLSNWTLNGTAFNNQPTYGNNTLARNWFWSNHKGDWWIGTFENRSSPSEPFGGIQHDGPQGSLTSPSFQITGKLLTFLIGAGCRGHTGPNIRAELIIGGEVVREKTPTACSTPMTEKSWNVTGYAGKHAQLRLVDHSSGYWGHINFDHLQACHKLISDTDP